MPHPVALLYITCEKDEPVQPIADFRNLSLAIAQFRLYRPVQFSNFGLIDSVQFSNFGFYIPVYSLNLLIELIDFGSVGVVNLAISARYASLMCVISSV